MYQGEQKHISLCVFLQKIKCNCHIEMLKMSPDSSPSLKIPEYILLCYKLLIIRGNVDWWLQIFHITLLFPECRTRTGHF